MSARLHFYVSRNPLSKQRHRWRIVAPNGRIIAQSSEGYGDKIDAERGAEIAMLALAEYAGLTWVPKGANDER